jgi:hypothetical protein
LRVLFEDSSNNEIAVIGGNIYKNKWNHIAATFQANDARIYVNGVQVGSNTSLANLKSVTGTLRIGMYSNSTYYNGLIDDVRIYNYARTPSQILQDYNAGLSAHFR